MSGRGNGIIKRYRAFPFFVILYAVRMSGCCVLVYCTCPCVVYLCIALDSPRSYSYSGFMMTKSP